MHEADDLGELSIPVEQLKLVGVIDVALGNDRDPQSLALGQIEVDRGHGDLAEGSGELVLHGGGSEALGDELFDEIERLEGELGQTLKLGIKIKNMGEPGNHQVIIRLSRHKVTSVDLHSNAVLNSTFLLGPSSEI